MFINFSSCFSVEITMREMRDIDSTLYNIVMEGEILSSTPRWYLIMMNWIYFWCRRKQSEAYEHAELEREVTRFINPAFGSPPTNGQLRLEGAVPVTEDVASWEANFSNSTMGTFKGPPESDSELWWNWIDMQKFFQDFHVSLYPTFLDTAQVLEKGTTENRIWG